MKKLNLPNEQDIKNYIEDIYIRGVELGKTKIEFHNFLQNKIAELANEFYLTFQKEYVLSNFYEGQSKGYIDVVWTIGATPVVAIEIDSALRGRSIRKLLASNANLLFWVYYGIAPFESLTNFIDIEGRVKVLHFPSKFERFGIKPQTSYKPIGNIETKNIKSYTFTSVREKYPKAYEKWSSDQDEILKKYFQKGLSVSEISKKLLRKPGAIRSRLRKLSLL